MYHCLKKSLESTNKFSDEFISYLHQDKLLTPFYKFAPDLSQLKIALDNRTVPKQHRHILYESLKEQYQDISGSIAKNQLDQLLSENTFTVTTGHQLCLFTGPMYFIYKIITVINLARQLKEAYPAYNFVPVYWMATEDHDFEEINHFFLFNKRIEWQTQQKGAVGRFVTAGIDTIFDTIRDELAAFRQAYLQHNSLASATRHLVDHLFGKYGLVIVDGDAKALKEIFKPAIKSDLFEHHAYQCVTETSDALKKLQFNTQVHPREINLFYLDDGIRERIIKENDDRYIVQHTDLVWSRSELEAVVETNPEKFSPNVVLRPLYQETILPNIAYIGGPAEIVYWLQLRNLFDTSGIDFPALIPRNFALIIPKSSHEKLKKLNLSPDDLFLDESLLKQKYLQQLQQYAGYDTSAYTQQITQLFDTIKQMAVSVDKSLEGYIEAEKNEAHKLLDKIGKRIKKATEQKEEEGIKQVLNLQQKLFPGGLQERKDNFLNFYLNNPDFIETLLQILDPMDFSFNILVEE